MLYTIVILFALAAIMGVIIAAAIITKKPSTPKTAVVMHGILNVTAVSLLIYYAIKNPDNYPKISLILFVIAVLGGLTLLVRDLNQKPGPVGLVIIHALVAVSAFALLLVFVF